MADIISKLTPQQALQLVERLARQGGSIREVVIGTAADMLAEVDVDAITDEVFDALDSVDVQDLWDRSGGSRDGYSPPDETAAEMIEEELTSIRDQIERYHDLGLREQEMACCQAVISGMYRFDRESDAEFHEWCEDITADCARSLIDEWQARNSDSADINAMNAFIREHCPEWAGRLTLDTNG
jgi:hypothetical protein